MNRSALVLPLGFTLAACQDVTRPDVQGPQPQAHAVEHITVHSLGTLGGARSAATAVNDVGQIVGTSETASGETRAFLWTNGVMQDLGTLGGTSSVATDINRRGQVVGYSTTASGETHAFMWVNGVMHDLGTLGGTFSKALAINNRGQVVGVSSTGSGAPFDEFCTTECHAFLWQDRVMRDLGTLPGGAFSEATDINDRGLVVGSSTASPGPAATRFAVAWGSGRIRDLGLGPSEATGINNSNQIVGQYRPGSLTRAFLWEHGQVTDLGTLGGTVSAATGINNNGEIVGRSRTATGEAQAFVWVDGVMTGLGTLAGDERSRADAINDQGLIVGQSSSFNHETSENEGPAVVWTRECVGPLCAPGA